MKRILPLILTILLIPGLLAVPARADGTDAFLWLNLLDYGYSSTGSNSIVWTPKDSGRTIYMAYHTPLQTDIEIIDVVVYTDDPFPLLDTGDYLIDPIDLGGGYFRFFASDDRDNTGQNTFTLSFNVSIGSFLEVLKLNVSTRSFTRYARTYSGYVYDFSYDPVLERFFSGNGNTPMEAVQITPGAASSNLMVGHVAHMDIPYWHGMDFIEVNIATWSTSLDSITVEIGGYPIPYTVNTIQSANVQGVVLYLIDLVIDVRNMDRNVSTPISVDVTGQVKLPYSGSFAVQSCLGLVAIEPFPTDTFWFTKLINSISSGFSSVGTWISDQTSSLVSWLSQINTSLAIGFDGVSTWLSYVHNAIGTGFSDVSTWISNQTFSISISISTWGQSLKDSIDALPDKIAEALEALMVPSDSAIQDFGESSQQIAQDRFGGVYEGAMIVDSFAGQLQAQAATQILTVPVVNLNILGTLFPLGGWEVDLVPEGSEVIIEAVKLMIDILATLAFINGIKSRLERTLEQ